MAEFHVCCCSCWLPVMRHINGTESLLMILVTGFFAQWQLRTPTVEKGALRTTKWKLWQSVTRVEPTRVPRGDRGTSSNVLPYRCFHYLTWGRWGFHEEDLPSPPWPLSFLSCTKKENKVGYTTDKKIKIRQHPQQPPLLYAPSWWSAGWTWLQVNKQW